MPAFPYRKTWHQLGFRVPKGLEGLLLNVLLFQVALWNEYRYKGSLIKISPSSHGPRATSHLLPPLPLLEPPELPGVSGCTLPHIHNKNFSGTPKSRDVLILTQL